MTNEPITEVEPEEEALQLLTEEEHWDDELKALVCIVESFRKLDEAAILRVVLWVRARYLPKKLLVDR